MTFTEAQQKKHRATFIEDCRQKAWGAACHAEWVAGQLDKLMEEYKRVQGEDVKLEAEIKELETAVDYHTLDNRNKRKLLQERRNQLAQGMKMMGAQMQRGQQGVNELRQSTEASLELAKHGEGWEWKEAQTQSGDSH